MAAVAFVLGMFAAAWASGDGARAGHAGASAHSLAPRFESLKSDRVALRNGPGMEFPMTWVLTRVGLPVEVLRETKGWRQVRDAEGTTGWVPGALLSARRTALVLAQNSKSGHKPVQGDVQLVEVRGLDTAVDRIRLDAGTLVAVTSCDGVWCDVASDDVKARIAQRHLWGVYPSERLR